MSVKVPPLYSAYRNAWSLLHVALVVLLLVLIIVWWVTDEHGAHLVTSWGNNISHVRAAIANAIPFPWG